jgi:hypothetical protein
MLVRVINVIKKWMELEVEDFEGRALECLTVRLDALALQGGQSAELANVLRELLVRFLRLLRRDAGACSHSSTES